MIKANEFRLGNLVYDARGEIQRVETLSVMLVGLTPNNSSSYDCILPIPLTEEIGIKLCNHLDSEYYFHNGYLCIDYTDYDGGTHKVVKCDYVHQLQNAWKVLTSEELQINL